MNKWFKTSLSSLIFSLDYQLLQKIYHNSFTIVLQCHLYPGAAGYEYANLKKILPFLIKYYTPVTLKDVFNSSKITSKPRIAIVVDDFGKGFTEKSFPLFQEFNVPFTLAVPIGLLSEISSQLSPILQNHISKFRKTSFECDSAKELEEIIQSGLVEIASHTLSHPLLNEIPEKNLHLELHESKRIIERHFNVNVYGFVYPFGYRHLISNTITNTLKDSGYGYAVTTEKGIFHAKKNQFMIPRMNGDLGLETLKAHLSLIHGYMGSL